MNLVQKITGVSFQTLRAAESSGVVVQIVARQSVEVVGHVAIVLPPAVVQSTVVLFDRHGCESSDLPLQTRCVVLVAANWPILHATLIIRMT